MIPLMFRLSYVPMIATVLAEVPFRFHARAFGWTAVLCCLLGKCMLVHVPGHAMHCKLYPTLRSIVGPGENTRRLTVTQTRVFFASMAPKESFVEVALPATPLVVQSYVFRVVRL